MPACSDETFPSSSYTPFLRWRFLAKIPRRASADVRSTDGFSVSNASAKACQTHCSTLARSAFVAALKSIIAHLVRAPSGPVQTRPFLAPHTLPFSVGDFSRRYRGEHRQT